VGERFNLLEVGRFNLWLEKRNGSFYLCGDIPFPFPNAWDGYSPINLDVSFRVDIVFVLEARPKEEDTSLVDLEVEDADRNRYRASEFLRETLQRYMENVFVPRISEELREIGWGPIEMEVQVSEVELLYRVGGEWVVKITISLSWKNPIDPKRVYQMALNPRGKLGFPLTDESDKFVKRVFIEVFPWDIFESESFATKFFTLWFPIYRHGTVRIVPHDFDITDSLFVQKNYVFVNDPKARVSDQFWRNLYFEVEVNKGIADKLLELADRPEELISYAKVLVGLLGLKNRKGLVDKSTVIKGLDYFLEFGGGD